MNTAARRNRLIKAQLALTRFYEANRLNFNLDRRFGKEYAMTIRGKLRDRINAMDGRIAAYSDATYPVPVRGHWTPQQQAQRTQWLDARDFEKYSLATPTD